MKIHPDRYDSLMSGSIDIKEEQYLDVYDHLGGFDSNYYNELLSNLNHKNLDIPINVQYTFDNNILDLYPNLDLRFSIRLQHEMIFRHLYDYNIHPEIHYQSFLCSFNGSPHVSRQLLTSAIKHFGMFNTNTCSKNFKSKSTDIIEQVSNLNLTDTEEKLYRKFFEVSDEFCNSTYTFDYERFKHSKNIHNVDNKVSQSFVHLVSETMATSYYPFITEKFLYSIVTRGLFVTYGQHNWHSHLNEYYGFKLYNNVFNYSFDNIKNPIKRLIAIFEMLLKFKSLTYGDLYDLYLLESDTIEYNYNHYFSKDYLNHVKQFER